MSKFVDFYKEAVTAVNLDSTLYQCKETISIQGIKVRCRFCLCDVIAEESSGIARCGKCGNHFSVKEKYSIDQASIDKMSGKQLYDASFYGGKILRPFLELSAQKQYPEALLMLAKHWEYMGDRVKAEQYYKTVAQMCPDGEAAYILYQFRQEPPVENWADLLVALDACMMKPFYYVDKGECLDVFNVREAAYIQYCKDEFTRRSQREYEETLRAYQQAPAVVEKDEYVDDDFYKNYYLPYLLGEKKVDGADWNGKPWTADHSNAQGV